MTAWRTPARMATLVLVVASFAAAPAPAADKKKASEKQKVENGPSCKAPAVGTCAACSITCRVAETATCSGGVQVADVCHAQPSCRCSKALP